MLCYALTYLAIQILWRGPGEIYTAGEVWVPLPTVSLWLNHDQLLSPTVLSYLEIYSLLKAGKTGSFCMDRDAFHQSFGPRVREITLFFFVCYSRRYFWCLPLRINLINKKIPLAPFFFTRLWGHCVNHARLSLFFFVNCRAPRFQPLMFTRALGRCRSRKQTGDIAALVFLTSSFPSGFRRDVGSNPRPPFRGS